MKAQHFYTKLLCQKPNQDITKWGVQNTPIAKNGLLPHTNSFLENSILV